jgi:hypothetical protein
LTKGKRGYIVFEVMNINVIVVNVQRDFWPSDAIARGRAYDEGYTHTSSRPETSPPVEEVIELLPQNGAWVGKRDMRSIRDAAYPGGRQTPKALYHSSPVMSYDHKGRVHTPSPDKGLHVNTTA